METTNLFEALVVASARLKAAKAAHTQAHVDWEIAGDEYHAATRDYHLALSAIEDQAASDVAKV